MDIEAKQLRIEKLNDLLRKQHIGGQIMVTVGVQILPREQIAGLLRAIANFDTFNDRVKDPYGEHNFGKLDFQEERYFWKIDYYDKRLTFASPDPADPAVTERVMTVMRAEEY